MLHIGFDKKRALAMLEGLRNGKPLLPAESDGWTIQEMIELSGACLYCVTEHFDLVKASMAMSAGRTYRTPQLQEHIEAEAMDVRKNSELAAHVVMELLAHAIFGGYDDRCEDNIELVIDCFQEDPREQVQVVAGMKDPAGN